MKSKKLDLAMDLLFSVIWREFIKPLEGQKIMSLSQKKINTVIEVNDKKIRRITSTGNTQSVPISMFRDVFRDVIVLGGISRGEINEKYGNRASSFVVPILGKIPFFEIENEPLRINLVKKYIIE